MAATKGVHQEAIAGLDHGPGIASALLSFRQKVESPGLSKRRFCAFDWPKRRSTCLGLSSFWRNDHTALNRGANTVGEVRKTLFSAVRGKSGHGSI